MDMPRFFSSALYYLQTVIYPTRCLICDGRGSKQQDLCDSCASSLPWIKKACTQCALPLSGDSSDSLLCGRCLKKQPFFDDSLSLFSFEKEVVGLMHQLKFHDKLSVSRLFGQCLTSAVKKNQDKPECLLPVPLFDKRIKNRGFNQSIEVCRDLKNFWQIPLETKSVKRVRETQSQTGLDAKQRRKNIKGAFQVQGEINYQHIAIVDDVVTTGSTVNELARVLKRSGVKRVSVYSIARAPAKY